jgi:rhodanese-related sulfurtransferase
MREESEYAKDHLPNAIHLGKGIIERDIEERARKNTPLVLYCGYRPLWLLTICRRWVTPTCSMDGGIAAGAKTFSPHVK